MKKVFVNAIYQENEVNIGAIILNKTFWETAPVFFPGQKLDGFKILDSRGDDFYILFRCCQFVVYCQKNYLGLTTKVYDFNDDFDKGLEEYTSLKKAGWEKHDIDKILSLLKDIQDNPGDLAEMVIQDPVPWP